MTTGNQFVTQQDLSALLDIVKREIMVAMNCHAVARIEKFDESLLVAQATLMYPKHIDGQLIKYPPLEDCPVYINGGGGCRLTFPIKKGDFCGVHFNDRDIDGWFVSGNHRALSTARLHSFSDATLLVGLSSSLEAVNNAASYGAYDTTRALLASGRNRVGAGPSGVLVANAITSLGTELAGTGGLIDQVLAACAVINALAPHSVDTVITNLGLIKGKLGVLLE